MKAIIAGYFNATPIVGLIIFLSLFLVSCDNQLVFEKNKSLPNRTWNKDYILKFNVPVEDTLSAYNFYINLRNSSDYGFCNLQLFLRTLYPDGTDSKDTIECIIARADGKWLGKGRNIIDNKILLRRNIRFRKAGIYSFEFNQAMRVDNLTGVEDFGIRIETIQ